MSFKFIFVLVFVGFKASNALLGPWRSGRLLKTADVMLTCPVTFGRDNINIYKVAKESTNLYTTRPVTACVSELCFTTESEDKRYRYSADSGNVYVNISKLSRSLDQMWLIATLGAVSASFFLNVITFPTVIQFISAPSVVDLAVADVVLRCETDCAYPAPDINWFYKEDGQPRQNWTSVDTQMELTGTCTDSEKYYRSLLSLAKYTVWPSNVDTTVNFSCGIISFPEFNEEIVSSSTVLVRFAVKVSSVQIYANSNNLTSLEVTSGVQTTLTCKPGSSRPAATLVWYIGAVKQTTTGTTFDYIPKDGDHGQSIYCKAFNFGNENEAVTSEQPVLYVKVPVRNVTLKDGTSFPTTVVTTSVNETKELTCETYSARPSPTVVWYIGNVEKFRSSITATLSFSPDNAEHNLEIYCKAFNIQPESVAVFSNMLKLYVKVPALQPQLSIPPSGTLEFLSGDYASVECTSSATRPTVNVIWKLQATQLANVKNSNISAAGELYQVISIVTFLANRTDTGKEVTCETFIDEQRDHPAARQNIKIYWPPSQPSIKPFDTFPWSEGQVKKSLECIASEKGNPVSATTWNTEIGQPADGYPSLLLIPVLEWSHHGRNISCNLANTYTVQKQVYVTAQITLVVEFAPVVFHSELIFAGREGGVVKVNVPFYCNPDVTTLQFFKYNDTIISATDKYNTSYKAYIINTTFNERNERSLNGYLATLTIKNVTEEDFLNYTLMLQNKKGKTSVHLLVISESIPSMPKHFYLELRNGIPVFIWERGFNGGFEQTFMIQSSILNSGKWRNLSDVQEGSYRFKLNTTFYYFNCSLTPGTYAARLIAYNNIGSTEPIYLTESFTIASQAGDTVGEDKQLPEAAIGGSVAGVLILTVLGIAVGIKRKREGLQNGCLKIQKDARQNTNMEVVENSYINLQSMKDNTAVYDLLSKTNEGSQYSRIEQCGSDSRSSAYERLQSEVKPNCSPTYDSLHLKDRDHTGARIH